MDEVMKAKEALFAAIKAGDVYQRFERAKELIGDYPEKKAQIDSFRRQAYLLSNDAEPLERMDEMNELFETRRAIRQDPDIDEYLDAELQYCRMVQNIAMELVSFSDMQIEAFEDCIVV